MKRRGPAIPNVSPQPGERVLLKQQWIELAKSILTHIQLRDKLEKTVVVRHYDGKESRILLNQSSFNLEGGSSSFA